MQRRHLPDRVRAAALRRNLELHAGRPLPGTHSTADCDRSHRRLERRRSSRYRGVKFAECRFIASHKSIQRCAQISMTINDEARMTNAEGMTKPKRISERSTFGFRHSLSHFHNLSFFVLEMVVDRFNEAIGQFLNCVFQVARFIFANPAASL